MNEKMVYAKLDALTESAMKETIRRTILESVALKSDDKVNGINFLENTNFNKNQVLDYMRNTVGPILETTGLNNHDKLNYNPLKKNVRSVLLPVYEIAQTLESARLGQLTEDSLDAVFVPNTIEALPDDIEGPEDVVNSDSVNHPLDSVVKDGEENVTEGDCGCEGDAADLINVDQYEENEVDTLDNTSDAEKNVVEGRYIFDRFGRKFFVENEEAFADGEKIENAEYHEPDPVEADFNSDADIEPYDPGHPALGADQGLFAPPTVQERALGAYAKYLFKEDENDLVGTTSEVEVEQGDNDIDTYEGEQAGVPGTRSEDQFDNSERGEEMAVAEAQVFLAKALIGKIFQEYGIKNRTMKKSMICEAIHYLSKYGINSIYPSVPDVADLVVEQNKLSEAGYGYSPSVICEATNYSYLNEVLSAKESKRFEQIAKAKASKKGVKTVGGKKAVKGYRNTKGKMVYSESVISKLEVAQALAEQVERDRQIFRSKMVLFSEAVKKAVAAKWCFHETAVSQDAIELVKLVNVRRYVTEGKDLKEFFKVIGEDSPISNRVFFRDNASANDSLVTAVLMTEAVANCKNIIDPCKKTKNVNECYKYAKDIMVENVIASINLCDSMLNPEIAVTNLREFASDINKGLVL